MKAIVRAYAAHDFESVRLLWEKSFPNDPPHNSAAIAIPAKLAVQPELFFVAELANEIVGTAMAGYDGHRGWLYAVAVCKSHQRSAIGSHLIAEAEKQLSVLGCNKINLQVRSGNNAVTRFYRSLGYAVEERISMGKRL